MVQTDKLLGLLGLAFRGRKVDLGEQPVLRALLENRAKLILLASDAGENTSQKFQRKASDAGVPVRRCNYDKSTLGGAFGRNTCAVAAVCEAGLANEIASRLTEM